MLVFCVSYLFFYYLFALIDRRCCAHPVPDWVWSRCKRPCEWCDYMENWSRQGSKPLTPYRVDARSIRG